MNGRLARGARRRSSLRATALLVVTLTAGCSGGHDEAESGLNRVQALLTAFCGGDPAADGGPISGIRVAGTTDSYSQETTIRPDTVYEVCVVPPADLVDGPTPGTAKAIVRTPNRITEHPTQVDTRVVLPDGQTHNLPLVLRTAPGIPQADPRILSAFTLDAVSGEVDTGPNEVTDTEGNRGVAVPCRPGGELETCGSAALFRLTFLPDDLAAVIGGVVSSGSEPFAFNGRFLTRVVVNSDDLTPDGAVRVQTRFQMNNGLSSDVLEPEFQLTPRGKGLSFSPENLATKTGPEWQEINTLAGRSFRLTDETLDAGQKLDVSASVLLDASAVDALCRSEEIGVEATVNAPGHATATDWLPFVAGPDLCLGA